MKHIAVAIPCYNESATIGKVVSDFHRALPGASIYVVDNNSTDGSAQQAQNAGALVLRESRRGKGWVMQSIFESIDADFLVVVDGDDTYPAEEVHRLLEPVEQGRADMVVGTRLQKADSGAIGSLHRWGNRLILCVLNGAFGSGFTDVLSGYRVFSGRFLRQVPVIATGFETEVELTIQALIHGMVVAEVPIGYRGRPMGSHSKLHPFWDGYRILRTIAVLLRDHKPLAVFGTLGFFCLLAAAVTGLLRLLDYAGIHTLPVALLSGLVILLITVGILLFGIGLILNSVNTGLRNLASLLRRPSIEKKPRITPPS